MNQKNQTNGYGISEYHDTAKLYEKFDRLINTPARALRPEALTRYLEEYFDKKCPKSKALYNRAKAYIPGAVQHNQAFNYPFPLAFSRAWEAFLEDIDGNQYIDFLQGGGSTLLGSNPKPVLEKVKALLDECGPVTCLFHEYEVKLAEFIIERFPGIDMIRLLGSGTEADMGAIRLARVVTGKKNIVKLGAGFHGWSDQLSYAQRVPGLGRMECHGIPRNIFKYIQEAFPNDIRSMERILKRNRFRGGTAAVIIEPLGPESGTRPLDYDYPRKVRELCDRYGALLIFDEVVTGFRTCLGGAQDYFGVIPDLTVLGKVIAGGYPAAGALGGKREHMERLAGGLGGKKGKKAHVGGTLAANPLSAAAGYYTLKELEKNDGVARAGRLGDRLTLGLKQLISKYRLPYVAYNQGSMVHLETAGPVLFDINLKRFWELPKKVKELYHRKDVMVKMGAAFMAEGLVTVGGSRMFTNAAFTEEIIDDALVRFDRVFRNVQNV
ncbi:MAG: aminotransferase class III-fold pyridoxal phosphate-dependent enzyme [Desulfobacterales bacterium]|nr:aminotransferase class III-fold pyridoxal phosphate-dependent enzyme [Desulfobacterales bacterium]